jgi:hypothetical protein
MLLDFKTVTKKLLAEFAEESIPYALIGGYAVGLWGVPRGTVDMDFLVRRDDMGKVHKIMESLGYEVRFASGNVSQYISPIAMFGEIDFLHAFRNATLRMLERSVQKTLFGDGISIQVLLPEDLIGLKVQAFSNDNRRESVDMYDIETLMKIHGEVLDWELVGEYFKLFESTPLFEELKRKYCENK